MKTIEEIFNEFKELNNKYLLISIPVEMEKQNENYFSIISNIYEEYISSTDFFDFDLIKDCFLEENEYLIKDYPYLKNGIYLLEALLTLSPAQIGDYPPPNVECVAYYNIEFLKFTEKGL